MPVTSRACEQRANDGDDHGHLDADQPGKLARAFVFEALDATTEPVFEPVDAPIELVLESIETPIKRVESGVESPFELSNRVANIDQRLSVLAHLALQKGHSFFERRHRGNLLEHSAGARRPQPRRLHVALRRGTRENRMTAAPSVQVLRDGAEGDVAGSAASSPL